jgi:hypothetical protein
MKVEKEKRKAVIVCTDGSLVKGLVHINPGERMIDFLNSIISKKCTRLDYLRK